MRGCAATLLFLIFFPMALGGLALTAISTWALDRTFYTDLFTDQRLYAAFLAEGANVDITPDSDSALDVQDAKTSEAFALATKEILSAEYLTATASGIVDTVFDFLEDTSKGLNLSVDLRPVKESLRGDRGVAFARTLAQNLPTCTQGAATTTVTTVTFPACRPENTSIEALEGQITPLVDQLAAALPDEQVLADNPIQPGELPSTSLPSLLSTSVITLLGVAGIFWLIIGVTGGTNRRNFFLWLGISLLVPAILILMAGIGTINGAAGNVIRSSLESGLSGNGGVSDPQIRTAFIDVFVRAVTRIGNGFLTVGGVASLVAVVLTVIGAVSPTRKRKNALV